MNLKSFLYTPVNYQFDGFIVVVLSKSMLNPFHEHNSIMFYNSLTLVNIELYVLCVLRLFPEKCNRVTHHHTSHKQTPIATPSTESTHVVSFNKHPYIPDHIVNASPSTCLQYDTHNSYRSDHPRMPTTIITLATNVFNYAFYPKSNRY